MHKHERKSGKKGIVALILALLVVGGAGAVFALSGCSSDDGEGTKPAEGAGEAAAESEAEENAAGAEEEPVDPVQAKIDELMSGMTLEEKVGQMFIARCPDVDAAAAVEQYKPGGYILFGRDFSGKSKQEIVNNIAGYQAAAKTPMFIGVDEEGGTVNRVSLNPSLRAVPFWAPRDLYASGGMDLIKSDTEEKCELLKSLGINLNFAPVCDISTNPSDFMYKRSFGGTPEATAGFVETVVNVMNEEKVGSVLKHFPGYGNNSDTHTGITYDNRSINTFNASDFIPFDGGIKAGASMVLVSHNVVNCMDPESPASISAKVHEILRTQLGFDGVVITDDLAMEGVKQFAGDTEIAVRAVQAGNDLLCCTEFKTQIPAVIDAVNAGTISEERIDESVERILKLKIELGIIEA